MKNIFFTGGGTAGHIFPGLAIITELQKKTNYTLFWIGNNKGMDQSIVSANPEIVFLGIPSGKLRRYFSIQNFFDVFKIFFGFVVSLFYLVKYKPIFLFSKGGFVSVPPCLAAKILRIPIITHECDYSPGLATKINARLASHILVTYLETKSFFNPKLQSKITVTGNPVRQEFYTPDPQKAMDLLGFNASKPILFFQGGSLGASQINTIVYESLEELSESFNIVHQTGPHLQDLETGYLSQHIQDSYRSFPFIKENIADILAASSLVISRSGANTIWECAAVGKPMFLIPLMKGSSRGDQIENASFFEKNGAACVFVGDEASSKNIVNYVHSIFEHQDKLEQMTLASKTLAFQNPAVIIAEKLLCILKA